MSKIKPATETTRNGRQKVTVPSKTAPRPRNKPAINTAAPLPLSWEATEDIPRRRWWWFALVGYIGISGMIIASALHTWSVAAVFFAAALVLIVTHARKPRTLKFVLDSDNLAVGEQVYSLNRYRSFAVEETPTEKNIEPHFLIVLLPKKRLGLALELTLPNDDQRNLVIAETFEGLLPYDEAASYQGSQRILNWMARWLRLN